MNKREALCQRAIEHVLRKYENTAYPETYPGCSEPGYNDVMVLAANWNHIPRKLYDWMEKEFDWKEPQLVLLEWSDEWIRCSHCYKAVRESPTSYGWLPSYVWVSDCEILCPDCYEDPDNEDWREEVIEHYANNPRMALPPQWDELLEDHGFECYSEDTDTCTRYQTGFHPHQTDDPKEIFKLLKEKFKSVWNRTQVVFIMRSKGQFDLDWGVYYRVREEDENDPGR